jgi:hypothetical protein
MAAWLSLLVGMAMFKRVMANRPEVVPEVQEEPEVVPEVVQGLELPDEDELDPLPNPTIGEFERAAQTFKDDLAAGRVPGLNRIRATCHVGHVKAPQIQEHLSKLAGQEAA